ncbi:hypothetical protein NPIL_680401 [Nephila pilipes]|uniref:Uncharacterized protein n=1 Tax=Nephila pilipes TaxID=299642 RepID=A0A8X6TKW4_NEPPI|nr:hypothetical protein NPIL_680401 [Nephila pilipes]
MKRRKSRERSSCCFAPLDNASLGGGRGGEGLVRRISRGIEVGGGQNIRHPIRHVINPVRSLMELNLQLHIEITALSNFHRDSNPPSSSVTQRVTQYLFLPENQKLTNSNWREFSTPNRNCHSLQQFDTDSDNRHRQHTILRLLLKDIWRKSTTATALKRQSCTVSQKTSQSSKLNLLGDHDSKDTMYQCGYCGENKQSRGFREGVEGMDMRIDVLPPPPRIRSLSADQIMRFTIHRPH